MVQILEESDENDENGLTADGGGVLEGGEDGWVHVDAEVLLLDNTRIPLVDPLLDPEGEVIGGGGMHDVAEPLLW